MSAQESELAPAVLVNRMPAQSPGVPAEGPLAFVSPPAVSSSMDVKMAGLPEVPMTFRVPLTTKVTPG